MPNLCCYCKAIYLERPQAEEECPCPYCGRVWFEEIDEPEREPLRKRIQPQKPIKPDLSDPNLLASQDLYDYMIDQGVTPDRARVKTASAESCGFVVDRNRLVNEERTRSYQSATQEDHVPNEEMATVAGAMVFPAHFEDPETATIERLDQPEIVLREVISKHWTGSEQDLENAAGAQWPGKTAPPSEKRRYKAEKQKLYRLKKKLKKDRRIYVENL
jgi:hypothetical protein